MFSYIVKDYKQVDKIMNKNKNTDDFECLYFNKESKKDKELQQVFNIQQTPFLLFIQHGAVVDMSYLR